MPRIVRMAAIKQSEALFGDKSLKERFGNLDGRELQGKIFESYMVLWLSYKLNGMYLEGLWPH